MTCCPPVVIGATCDDQINYGESIDLEFTYNDENGAPMDLSSTTVSVFASNPPVIKNSAQVTVSDALNGKVRFYLDRDSAMQLRSGRSNSFSILAVFGAQSDDVTPDIYLQVA